MSKGKFDIRSSTILAILASLLMLGYYLGGLAVIPQPILLPIAGQVLSVGIHSLSTIIFSSLTRFTARKSLPIDAITPFLVNLDTQVSGSITPERLVLAPLVNLLLLHTPETLLGTLASGKSDIRSLPSRHEKVELGPFGGAYNKETYYLSGQLLLSATNPDTAYKQVAYRTSLGWVLPRKPVLWYEVFARTFERDNDAEKRISVPINDAAILVPVPTLPPSCNQRNISDFGYWLALHHCGSYIGFSLGGARLSQRQGFYQFHRGQVSADYLSGNGERFVQGSLPSNMVPLSFPRVEELWDSMANCFLNAISFNRTPGLISLTDRLALSSIVRIAGFENYSGFSTPPAMADAIVSDVMTTNISRWVVATMGIAVAIDLVRLALSKFKFELLAPELGTLVASLRDVEGLKPIGRRAQKGRKPYHRAWGWFERDEDGGGRWIVPGGLSGEPEPKADEEGGANANGTSDTGGECRGYQTMRSDVMLAKPGVWLRRYRGSLAVNSVGIAVEGWE